MTDLATETAAQRRWRRLPAAVRVAAYDAQLVNEFTAPEEWAGRQARALARVLRWATAHVPYYRERLAEHCPAPGEPASLEGLAALPVLTKLDVQTDFEALVPAALPRGEVIGGLSRSSGTSGRQPTRVVHSRSSFATFACLKQRELRWFRFDPAATLGWIRLPAHMAPGAGGEPLGNGETLHHAGWPSLEQHFATGPFVGFAVTNPVQAQVAWLETHRPAYLVAYAESLEHLAFAWGERPPPGWLRGLLAISEQVTAGMREKIERTFDAPLHENYGLNEIGVIATRCPEGGRFHVHTEACIVEIVDEANLPVAPGDTGRVLVTVLCNPAMPLIRYDTGDLARAAAGPCPCGRTLPSFDGILGRYSRIAYLPEGTLTVVGALREAIETLPASEVRDLREFQIHQAADGSFTLRLVCASPPGEGFRSRVTQAFLAASGGAHGPLAIERVDAIARAPGGKFQDFTSAFMPAADARDRAPEHPP